MSEDLVLKILLLGETTVGKSSILKRYIDNAFMPSNISNIGFDVQTKIIKYKSKTIKLNLNDTSGQERFKSIVPSFYKGTDGILLVFDLTRKETFEKIEYWINQIQEKAPKDLTLVIFGNKNDVEEREVTKEEAKKASQKYEVKVYEGSAKNGKGIKEAINELVEQIVFKRKYCNDESLNQSIKLNKSVFGSNSVSWVGKEKKTKGNYTIKDKDVSCC